MPSNEYGSSSLRVVVRFAAHFIRSETLKSDKDLPRSASKAILVILWISHSSELLSPSRIPSKEKNSTDFGGEKLPQSSASGEPFAVYKIILPIMIL